MAAALIVAACASHAFAASDALHFAPREYLVKSAFIYRLAKFVRWSKAPNEPLRLCVFGRDPFRGALDSIAGRTVDDRLLAIVWPETPAQLAVCDILFLSDSERNNLATHLEPIAGRPVLTISDSPDFTAAGGIIALKTVDNRLRFDINLNAAGVAGLEFSAQLLSVADVVSGEAGEAGIAP